MKIAIINLLLITLLILPCYGDGFYDTITGNYIKEASITIEYMNSDSAIEKIKSALSMLDSVEVVSASASSGEMIVRYDKTKLRLPDILNTIRYAGFNCYVNYVN